MGGKGGGNQHLYDDMPTASSRGAGGWVYADTGLPTRPKPPPKPVETPPDPIVKPPPERAPDPPPDLSFLSENFGHYENMNPLGDALVQGLRINPQQMQQGQV